MINFEDFCVELFQILRAYSREMVLYDRTGNRVYEPSEARRFYLTGDNILISISEKGDDSSLKLYLSPSLNLSQVSGFIETLRVMASNSNLLFHVKKYDKEIRPQDFATKASVNENQELSMNIMEGMYGTSKSSYLNMENARMIVRHTARINENMIGSRGRHIKAIFVENAQGERFLFPVNVLAGAKAMTQHVNNGGSFEDQVGSQIIRMANDFRNLAKIAHPGAKNLVAQPEEFTQVRESAVSAMKQTKLAFARIASERSYIRECEKLTAASALMETSEDLSEKIAHFTAILGESFSDAELNTYARLFNITETIAQFEEIVDDEDMMDDGEEVDERTAMQGVDVEEYFEFKVGDMVQPKDSPEGEPFAVIDVNGDIVTVKDEAGNTGKMNSGDLEPASQEHIDLPITNNESIQQFESWMEEFNPDSFLNKEKVEEMPSIRDMQSGFMKSQSSNSAVGRVRGGHETVTLRNGKEYKSMGPTKSSQMVAGTIVLASYSSYNQGADVLEVLGYRTDYHGDDPEFASLKDMAKKYGAKTLAALDEAVREAKGGEYGNGVYMCVKDLDDGSHGSWFYVSGGRFCRGSGAERLSFTKLEAMTSESMDETRAPAPMTMERMAKKVLPASFRLHGDTEASWNKRGISAPAMANGVRRIIDRALAMGFVEGDTSMSNNADGSSIGSGYVYSNPEGYQLRISQNLGSTAYDNTLYITLKKTEPSNPLGEGDEELNEYRIKKPDSEVEPSMHDLKTLLNHHKAELSKMSPFDASYGKMRSEIKELEAKIAKAAPYGKSSSVDEGEQLDEYRVKKEVEPDVSIHDLKSTLQSLEIKLKSMSPFDSQYGAIRSQMRDVERQIAKNAPYGKASTVDEATSRPTSYVLTVPADCPNLLAFLQECEFEEIEQWVDSEAYDISENIGSWSVESDNTILLSPGASRVSPKIQAELQRSFDVWCREYESNMGDDD